MEQSADTIRSHEAHVVVGLLQIPDYTAAIARSVGVAPTSDSYVQWNIEQRALRQKRTNDGDLNLSVVQPEIPLHLQMGDRSTMAAQLAHLVAIGRQPNVTIQIVPFSVGQYEALRAGSISIMTHPWSQGPTVFHQRYNRQAAIEDANKAAGFVAAWEQASELAPSPADSRALITETAEAWSSRAC